MINRNGPEEKKGGGKPSEAYPFPESEWRAWWDDCHPQVRRDWAPILRAMSPEERSELHATRLGKAAGFHPANTAFGRGQREEAERILYAHWAGRLRGRLPAGTKAEL